jgi:hypothetical protein
MERKNNIRILIIEGVARREYMRIIGHETPISPPAPCLKPAPSIHH